MPEWTAFVMPCLNEEALLVATCRSLGFGHGLEPPQQSHLIIVDNGSTDSSVQQCLDLQQVVGRDAITVVNEPIRGHVPARHRGVEAAATLALAAGAEPADTVIVQVDADTTYSPTYAATIVEALRASPNPNTMVVATTTLDPTASQRAPLLTAAMRRIDAAVSQVFPPHRLDVLIDDKACAYSLASYRRWGGHRREYRTDGSELLAETTRMFTAAQVSGATQLEAEMARATHSQRRMFSDAAEILATAGYPYPQRTSFTGSEQTTLDMLERQAATDLEKLIDQIARPRVTHLLALTQVLPEYIASTLGAGEPNPVLREVVRSLPELNKEVVERQPGRLLDAVLSQISTTCKELRVLVDRTVDVLKTTT